MFRILTPNTIYWPVWMGPFFHKEKLLAGSPIEVSIKTHWKNAKGAVFDTTEIYILQATSSAEEEVFSLYRKESSLCELRTYHNLPEPVSNTQANRSQ